MRRPRKDSCWELIRLVIPALVIATFLLFFLSASVFDETHRQLDIVFPDFSHYKFLHTLPDSLFPAHQRDDSRVVAIGDIHGINDSLSALLAKISYDPQSDTLVHLGDLLPKEKKVPSEPILSFVATNHILGVRGNNDQKVIEWRAWMVWISSLPGGRDWLEDMNENWSHVDGDSPNAKFNAWLKKKSRKKWLAYVPHGWKLQGIHYKVAQEMSQDHFDYLRSLPLVLHAPTAHTFFVHAGLLPADPTREITDPKQPLSHLPVTADPEDGDHNHILRSLQELALLNEIPQNQDPWVLMNMRSLTESGKVEDGKKGIPWSDLWNDVMDDCTASLEIESHTNPSRHSSAKRPSLQCFPSTVMYGHAAARDLDVKRWSVGLDTGCTYGRRLTAVILDAGSLSSQTRAETFGVSSKDSLIPYGDAGIAQIVSVKCHA